MRCDGLRYCVAVRVRRDFDGVCVAGLRGTGMRSRGTSSGSSGGVVGR